MNQSPEPVDISKAALSQVSRRRARGARRITFEEAQEIRREYATEQFSTQALGDKYGISKQSVSQIIHWKTYKYP